MKKSGSTSPAPADSTAVPVSSGSAITLSASQIAQYAADAGFQGDDLTIAVAVALAESGGKTGAYNPVTNLDSGAPASTPQGQGATGLWQIYVKVHPEFSGWDLTDPAQNAAAAFSVWSAAGGSWRPWTTYTTGRYQAYMGTATGAVNA
jgi:hypothetical protein